MKKLLFLVLLFAANPAQAAINVFTCEPEWKALAEEIGKENVKAFSATSYRQDPHHIRAKPSLLAKMRTADLVICTGAGLEAGWLPVLLQKVGNAPIIYAADHANILGKQQNVDRSMGDIHPEGNPHLHLDPNNILKVGTAINNRLQLLDAANKDSYQKNWQEFKADWQNNITKWKNDAASLKGLPVIVHHDSWLYLAKWLGLKQVATLEPKPGIPPTTGHLEQVMKTKAAVIIRAPFNPADASEWLASKTATPALVLPFTVNDSGNPAKLADLFDTIITELKANAKL